jgi:gliding motility-associated-like protein
LNDSIVTATINQVWQGRLLATINGCRLLQDSVRLTVLQSPGVLKLGTDTVICAGNKLLLNAKKGYATYTWQNGSSDSTFLVTAPGKYYVTVTDACSGLFSDTIIVSAHPPIPFELGPNLAICENDTLFISAQAGFIHYKWTGEKITDDTLQTIIAFPTASNWYKVTAEKEPGCFVSDSLYVTLKQTPAIHLGPDTSICAGEQLLLNAGPGFTSYEWSTGELQQQIAVGNKGSYSVKATLNGCYAYDTLQVLNVSPFPIFSLGSDTSICQGRQLPLIVNLAQATYKWNDGSTASTYIITQAGAYWLKVSQQGCSKSDTINVTFITTPLVNLGRDTSLCEGKSIQLNAGSNGATYTWQDSSITSGYLVKGPGRYFVIARLGNCDASDTIFVSYTSVPQFSLGRDTFLCEGQQLVLTPLLNSPSSLLWQDGRTSPSITVTKNGLYSLQATNECGSYKDTINITTGLCNIEMPSAFTPNGDVLNDVFKVKYPFPVKQFSMTIYNRYGEKVFETNNISEGWDGNWKGTLQLQGTYVWIISFKGINNRQQNLKGTVTLIR